MESAAGHWQGQPAKDPLLGGVKGTGHIKGDGNGKQADREVHQVGVQRQGVRKVVGPEGGGDLQGGGLSDGGHDSTPARMASTTLTVCRP